MIARRQDRAIVSSKLVVLPARDGASEIDWLRPHAFTSIRDRSAGLADGTRDFELRHGGDRWFIRRRDYADGQALDTFDTELMSEQQARQLWRHLLNGVAR